MQLAMTWPICPLDWGLVQGISRHGPKAWHQGFELGLGVDVCVVQVVQSDYAKLESTTEAQEASAEKDFTNLKSEMAVLEADLRLCEFKLQCFLALCAPLRAWSQAQQEKDLEHKKLQKGEKDTAWNRD